MQFDDLLNEYSYTGIRDTGIFSNKRRWNWETFKYPHNIIFRDDYLRPIDADDGTEELEKGLGIIQAPMPIKTEINHVLYKEHGDKYKTIYHNVPPISMYHRDCADIGMDADYIEEDPYGDISGAITYAEEVEAEFDFIIDEDLIEEGSDEEDNDDEFIYDVWVNYEEMEVL